MGINNGIDRALVEDRIAVDSDPAEHKQRSGRKPLFNRRRSRRRNTGLRRRSRLDLRELRRCPWATTRSQEVRRIGRKCLRQYGGGAKPAKQYRYEPGHRVKI